MSHWNQQAMRLGDRERQQALKALAKHRAKGRIDDAEHAERADAIASARTVGDLYVVFADLGWRPQPSDAYGSWRRKGPRRGPFPVVPLLLVVAIVLAATNTIPWLPVLVGGAAVLLLAPWRHRRWSGRRGYAC